MNFTIRRRGVFVALASFALLAACGGAPRVRITSQPETARIYVNGVLVGNTPADVALPFNECARVYVQVVHPAGRMVGEQIYTKENLPEDGQKSFELR